MEYEKVLERIAADEPIDAVEARNAVYNTGLSIVDLLLDMREACDRREWCDRCGERGIKRTSRTDADGDMVVLIICPKCKRPLSKQKRRTAGYVHIHKLEEKLLSGSDAAN